MKSYDEAGLIERLSLMGRSSKVAFAAACAQRVLPLYIRFYGDGANPNAESLAKILESVWGAAEGKTTALDGMAEVAESLVPPDDDKWPTDPAYAQSAAASVAYAASVWQSNDPGDAELAARQVYDVADFAAWTLSPIVGSVPPGAANSIERQLVVQLALDGIEKDLAAAEDANGSEGWSGLRKQALEEGEAWCKTLP